MTQLAATLFDICKKLKEDELIQCKIEVFENTISNQELNKIIIDISSIDIIREIVLELSESGKEETELRNAFIHEL